MLGRFLRCYACVKNIIGRKGTTKIAHTQIYLHFFINKSKTSAIKDVAGDTSVFKYCVPIVKKLPCSLIA